MITPHFVRLIHKQQENEMLLTFQWSRRAVKPDRPQTSLREWLTRHMQLKKPSQQARITGNKTNPFPNEEILTKPCNQ